MSRINLEGNRIEDALLIKPKVPLTTASASPTRISNDGITRLTATGTLTIVMEAPYAGARKIILKSITATGVLTITGSATSILFNTTTGTSLTFDGVGEMIELVGLSTTAWAIVSNQNSVGVS